MWLSEGLKRLVTKCCTKTHRVHLLRVKHKGKWKKDLIANWKSDKKTQFHEHKLV